MNDEERRNNAIINSDGYQKVLQTMKERGYQPILIAITGSHGYGTNVEGSDIDIRGIYINSVNEILGIAPDKEQIVYNDPDVQVYSLKKALWLLKKANPAMLELLGCRPSEYLYLTQEGKWLIDNAQIFLSKDIVKTFGGYVKSQLNRLANKSGRGKDEILENEQRSYEKAFLSYKERFKGFVSESSNVYMKDDTLYCSIAIEDAPLERFAALTNEINAIHKDYGKSVRNDKAHKRGQLAKHMMHLFRLYIMGIDALEHHVIQTYRKDEHDFLMSVRNGIYLEDDGITVKPEFYEVLNKYEKDFQYWVEHTSLPEKANDEDINDLAIAIQKPWIMRYYNSYVYCRILKKTHAERNGGTRWM